MNFIFDKGKTRHTKWWLFLALFLALLASYPLSRPILQLAFDPTMPGGLAYARQEHKNRLKFNSETWKAFPRSTNEWPHTMLLPVRIRMVDDLLAHHDFKGQLREEVERMLGLKTKTEYFSDWDLVYYLGPGRYGNAVGDSEWLVFRFDSTNRVLDYKIVHDQLSQAVALEHGMPPKGIDRLCMMLLGQESIRDVILFPRLKLE